MSKLLAVGTVAFDAIETPFGKTDKILGGSGTFVGLAASQFGVETGVVSVVGGDFPQSYLDMMNAKGINTDGIEIIKDKVSKSPDYDLAQHIKNELKDHYILISTDGPFDSVIKSKPPLCFTKENAKRVVDTIRIVLEKYYKH